MCYEVVFPFLYIAPSDYGSLSGQVTITDDTQIQCIPISIVFTNNAEEDVECFVFGISATDAVIGLTVDPVEATVCIMKRDGERAVHQLYEKY